LLKHFFISKTDNTLIQLFRYTFVGGVAFLVDFGFLYFLTEFGHIYYLVSAAIAFLFGLITNYVISITWVFGGRNIKNRWIEFFLFSVIGVVGLGLNEIIMWIATEKMQFHYLLSKIAATIIVYLWNFFGRKYLLF
jgi:putative flippase GtrA